jgi:flagellar biosynthetic protein FliP
MMIRGADRRRAGRRVSAIVCAMLALGSASRATGALPPASAGALGPDAAPASSAAGAVAADHPLYVPDLTRWLPPAQDRSALSSSLQILIALTVLTLAPSIILMMTCFVRILVVLALLRMALGTQSLPPTQVLVALALFMTLLVMAPTIETLRAESLDPYLRGQIGQMEALTRAGSEMRGFMFDQIEAAGNEQDVYMMHEYARRRPLEPSEIVTREQVATSALLPAFLLSELKVAFVLGFRIYLPFLVIDMVISTVLVAMGMMMLPPVLISLPFKLLLFVLADGWHLVAGSLMSSVVQIGSG